MEIKLSKESASILYVFVVNTNGLYLQEALGEIGRASCRERVSDVV